MFDVAPFCSPSRCEPSLGALARAYFRLDCPHCGDLTRNGGCAECGTPEWVADPAELAAVSAWIAEALLEDPAGWAAEGPSGLAEAVIGTIELDQLAAIPLADLYHLVHAAFAAREAA